MTEAVSSCEMTEEPMTCHVDFEDDVEQHFQCTEEQRADEFWSVMCEPAAQSMAPRHRFTWQTALAVDELQCMPRGWRRSGWRAYLSVYAAAALQWPGDAKAQLIGRRALLSSSAVRAISRSDFDAEGAQEGAPDRDSVVLLCRHPGVEEWPHAHVYLSRLEEGSLAVDLPCLDERQVAQAHRLNAASFERYLAEVGVSPSDHIVAWLDASNVAGPQGSHQTRVNASATAAATSRRVRGAFGGVLGKMNAAAVLALSDLELRAALAIQNIEGVRVSTLLGLFLPRIAKDVSGGEKPGAEHREQVLAWLEEWCHQVVFRKAENPMEKDWYWFMKGLSAATQAKKDNAQPLDLRSFAASISDQWVFATTGVKKSKQRQKAT